jgi:hypothetical protein
MDVADVGGFDQTLEEQFLNILKQNEPLSVIGAFEELCLQQYVKKSLHFIFFSFHCLGQGEFGD